MGLKLPTEGAVYLDANTFIYSVEKVPEFWPSLRALWERSKAGELTLISSELLLLEAMVGPLKKGDGVLQRTYEEIFATGEIVLYPISRRVLERAAELRAQHGLKTPDAIHAATGLAENYTSFLTNDRTGFDRVPTLPLVPLREVVVTP